MNIKNLCSGVKLCYHKTSQFKTSVVSLNIITPLDDKASHKTLLANLLARTNKNNPTITAMNRKLASLYGAVIHPSVQKIGESQVLTLSLICIDERFALDKESVLTEGINLLLDCLFTPDITPKGFKEENVQREKRLLCEKIDSENDDKIRYAYKKMISEMCCDENYGISELGEKDEINALTGEDLFSVWKQLLLFSQIQLNIVGNFSETLIEDAVLPRFEALERKKTDITEVRTEFITESYGSKTVTEKQKVQQGKLVIGFRAGMTYDMDNFAAIKVMTAIFGSGTFSKLFTNVREKMSLCYYCSARLISAKGIIAVQSGVETENIEKALNAIRHELDDMRLGNFTDDDIKAAKLSLKDAFSSVCDSVTDIDSWFTSQCLSSEILTPEDYIDMIEKVSREEIIVAANMVSEDTVFILESEKEEA